MSSLNIPFDIIRDVQNQIREQSGFANYDPDNSSLPSLPTFQDVIAELDPSPSYLRCKLCKGKFLSGVRSLFCVYCGAEQHDPEMPPEAIKFNSTVAYRWLLDALKLDGSEIVGKGKEENVRNRARDSREKELTISELLDLEIRWPERPKKVVAVGDELSSNKSSLNVTGVDVEDFFPSTTNVATGSLEKKDFTKYNESIERTDASGQEEVDLFENVSSTEADVHHDQDDSGDGFSGWATEFQGATSGHSQNEGHSFDSFVISSDLSAQINTVVGSDMDSKVEKTVADPIDPSPGNNDWNEDDWNSFSSGIPKQPYQQEALEHQIENDPVKLDDSSNPSDNWVLGDQWQTNSGNVANSVNTAVVDDSYDVWNDFSASSSTPQHQNNGSLPSESQARDINLFSFNDLQDDNFGDFSQPALVSPSLQSEANVSSRLLDLSIKPEELDAKEKGVDEVEFLMSQMHDLSFMLKSNLSIPKATSDSSHPVLES